MINKFLLYILKAGVGFALGVLLLFSPIGWAKTTIDASSIETIAKSIVKEGDADLLKAKKIAVFVATHFERDGFLEKEKYNASKKNKIYEKLIKIFASIKKIAIIKSIINQGDFYGIFKR